ncbi:MAG: hypothetical protein ACRCTU_14920 [Zoogloea sp.]|uniref:hypothetical protein n=1 Tax=Zoogloea sp. TaxID=49181 RepID=UPI003F3543D3|nr:hypothetical protein [Rhodocyclales bacterium]
MLRSLALSCGLAALAPACLADTLLPNAFTPPPGLDEFSSAPHSDWLEISGLSHHFQPDRRHWREVNPGLGLEREFTGTPWVMSAGYFRNSYDKGTAYVGGRWMPLALGPFRFGAYGLLATGYPSPVLLLPAISVEAGRVGANLVALPNLPGYSGYLGLQIRLKLN